MYFLLIFSFLINIFHATNDDDFEKYEKAYDYIVHASIIEDSFIHSKYSTLDTILIHVSNKLNNYSPRYFSQEILEYEYKGFNDSLRKIKLDSLWDLSSLIDDFKRIDEMSELDKLNRSEEINLLLFFSKISDNKLTAEIFQYRPDIGKKHNRYWSGTSVHFLFYFNEDDIEKVFYNVIAKN